MNRVGPHVFPKDEKGSCPVCDAMGLTGFDWEKAKGSEAPHPVDSLQNAHDIASQLDFLRHLKFGDLYRCKLCDRRWYLNEDTPLMERVPTPRRDLLDEWDAGPLTPSNAALEVMKVIGATGCDAYGNGRGEWKVPCAVRWPDGNVSNPCVVIISKRPPLDDWRPRVALLTGDATVDPSDYALPQEVRRATHNAIEESMGFSPTLVERIGGASALLNGAQDVLAFGDLRGSDIRLAPEGTNYDARTPILHSPPDFITHVYCDWFPSCADLALPGDWTPGRAWGRTSGDLHARSTGIIGGLRRIAMRVFSRFR